MLQLQCARIPLRDVISENNTCFPPVALLEEEVPGSRHSEFSGEDGFDVPRDEEVDDGVEHEHENATEHVVAVARHRTRVDVVPLNSDALLLEEREVVATPSERHRVEYALQKLLSTLIFMSTSFSFKCKVII